MNTKLIQFFGFTISICTGENGRFESFSITRCKECVIVCDTTSEAYQKVKAEGQALLENDDFMAKIAQAKAMRQARKLETA